MQVYYGWKLSIWTYFSLLGVGVAAFVATNIDDLFILVFFFASVPRFPISQIVMGQYVGMGSLIAVSLLGSLISLVIPNNLLGLMGFFRLLLESRSCWSYVKGKGMIAMATRKRLHNKAKYLPFLTVAAVTFSGAEVLPFLLIGLGIYTLAEAYT